MKDSIIVRVSELRSIIQDIRRSGSELVCLSINEGDDELPPFLSFSACKEYDPDTWIDFDGLDAVPNEDELAEKECSSMHMSSELL